ncbi:MAG: phosphoglycerate kinase, partial [Pseudomonadota bacterium]|nr:phosphoglycerate kinase [Pseudomonadota bacterium]
IRRIIPGLEALRNTGARIIILTHLGRPKGKVAPEFSVVPVAARLAELLGCQVPVEADLLGAGARDAVAALADGEVVMMENLRFHSGEEANDPEFAAALASLGDIYVGDAFSCTHRAHASVEALPRLMKVATAGRALGAELAALHAALASPARPVAAIVGGAKVSTKLQVLENLITKTDRLVLGGGMANTFLMAAGQNVGASLVEAEMVDTARAISEKAATRGCQIVLPEDFLVARTLAVDVPHRIAMPGEVSADEMILDAGPQSVATAVAVLATCRTVVWNGPMGAFEFPPFDSATNAVARAVAAATQAGDTMSVAGGGDTLAALANAGVSDQFSYVSTAGGAFLEWLEGRELPGVEALRRQT